jgi:ribonuclease P protein component
MAARFGRARRIRLKTDFERVWHRGVRLDGPLFLLLALANGRGGDRLGLAAGRRLGGAVRRNRARRLVRDGFRRLGPAAGPGQDIVIVLKQEIVGRSQAEVESELEKRIRRLRRRQGGGPGPMAAPAD